MRRRNERTLLGPLERRDRQKDGGGGGEENERDRRAITQRKRMRTLPRERVFARVRGVERGNRGSGA